MIDDVMLATSTIMPASAYESPWIDLRYGNTAGSEPWFVSITRCPRARRPINLALGRTRDVLSVIRDAAAPVRAAGFESAMTLQWYTTSRDGGIVARSGHPSFEGPRAGSRLALRARSRRHAALLPRSARPPRGRHRQGGTHRFFLRRSPPSRRLVRGGARGRPRSSAEGRARPLPRRVRGGHVARRAGRGPTLGGGSRSPAVRRDGAVLL